MFSRQFWADLTERVVSTFAQAVLGAGTIIDFGSAKTYEIAGIAAAVAVLKGLAALRVGAPDSASLLPADVDPPQGDPAPEPADGAVDMGAIDPGSLALGLVIGAVLVLLLT